MMSFRSIQGQVDLELPIGGEMKLVIIFPENQLRSFLFSLPVSTFFFTDCTEKRSVKQKEDRSLQRRLAMVDVLIKNVDVLFSSAENGLGDREDGEAYRMS